MGRAQARLKRDVRKEQRKIQAAGRKRGLWASIGSTLGSILAMAVTGGAAAPLIAGLATAGLSYVGGSLGNFFAKQTKGGKIKGGKFFQEERESLASQIQEGVEAQAIKSGMMKGLTKMGGKLTYGKGGLSVTSAGTATASTGGSVPPGSSVGGFSLKKLFERAGPEDPAGTYSQGLFGRIGKSLDFKGSFIGEKIEAGRAASEAAQLAQASQEWSAYGAQQGLPPAYGDPAVSYLESPVGVGTGFTPDEEWYSSQEYTNPFALQPSSYDLIAKSKRAASGARKLQDISGGSQWWRNLTGRE